MRAAVVGRKWKRKYKRRWIGWKMKEIEIRGER